jgi:hypothetical protein
MTISLINRLVRLFADACGALGAAVPLPEIERLAMEVHRAMEGGRRIYHTTVHVLDMCRDANPRQTLAALYHDVVYRQLDDGFPEPVDALLRRVIRRNGEALRLRDIDPADTELAMCAALFGLRPGDLLPPYGGMNEFLSAVVAARRLAPHLRRADLLAVLAAIEATIPFRGPGPVETLAARLAAVSASFGAGLDAAAIDAIVRDAVIFANRDVGNFAGAEPGRFLSATWMLIEESNAPLERVGVYTLRDYRKALQRMEGFLAALDPDHVFHAYRGTPPAAEMARLAARAAANLRFAVGYLGAKLAAIAVVEAIALETGGDAPVSMFLGDIAAPDGRPDRVEDFLPVPPARDDLDSQLLAVLEKGRSLESSNDLTASPLTAYLYRALGPAGLHDLVVQARRMFAGELAPAAFLAGLPREPGDAVIEGCARIALTRANALRVLRGRLAA